MYVLSDNRRARSVDKQHSNTDTVERTVNAPEDTTAGATAIIVATADAAAMSCALAFDALARRYVMIEG